MYTGSRICKEESNGDQKRARGSYYSKSNSQEWQLHNGSRNKKSACLQIERGPYQQLDFVTLLSSLSAVPVVKPRELRCLGSAPSLSYTLTLPGFFSYLSKFMHFRVYAKGTRGLEECGVPWNRSHSYLVKVLVKLGSSWSRKNPYQTFSPIFLPDFFYCSTHSFYKHSLL